MGECRRAAADISFMTTHSGIQVSLNTMCVIMHLCACVIYLSFSFICIVCPILYILFVSVAVNFICIASYLPELILCRINTPTGL